MFSKLYTATVAQSVCWLYYRVVCLTFPASIAALQPTQPLFWSVSAAVCAVVKWPGLANYHTIRPSPDVPRTDVNPISYYRLDTSVDCFSQDPCLAGLSVMFYGEINSLLNTKRRLLYLKTQFVPRSKHFSSRL